MHGHEKSDPFVVAVKPANKGRQLLAESVEPREGAEGTARTSMSHGLDRVRQAAKDHIPWPSVRFAVKHPRWEPGAGIPPAGICAGGVW